MFWYWSTLVAKSLKGNIEEQKQPRQSFTALKCLLQIEPLKWKTVRPQQVDQSV